MSAQCWTGLRKCFCYLKPLLLFLMFYFLHRLTFFLWPLPYVLFSAQVYLQWTIRYMHMFSIYNQTCKRQVPRAHHLANHGQSAVVKITCYWQARFNKELGSPVNCSYFEENVIIYPKTQISHLLHQLPDRRKFTYLTRNQSSLITYHAAPHYIT